MYIFFKNKQSGGAAFFYFLWSCLKTFTMLKINIRLIFLLFSIWMVAQSTTCGRPRPFSNCPSVNVDSIYLNMSVTNNAATFTLADSIKLFSKISDTITPVMSSGFITPIGSLATGLQMYKVVPAGSGYQLNFANVEFNVNIQNGTFYYGQGYNLLYNRMQPYNTLQFSLKPGATGLYIAVLGNFYSNFRNPNDECVSFQSSFRFKSAEQNLQYWNNLNGATSLSIGAGGGGFVINKNDKNYFFIKII